MKSIAIGYIEAMDVSDDSFAFPLPGTGNKIKFAILDRFRFYGSLHLMVGPDPRDPESPLPIW